MSAIDRGTILATCRLVASEIARQIVAVMAQLVIEFRSNLLGTTVGLNEDKLEPLDSLDPLVPYCIWRAFKIMDSFDCCDWRPLPPL